MSKYSSDGPFMDPVVRCDSCQRLLMVERLREHGACVCGCTKVKNLRGFDSEELERMKERNIDPEFLSLFEPIPEKEGATI